MSVSIDDACRRWVSLSDVIRREGARARDPGYANVSVFFFARLSPVSPSAFPSLLRRSRLSFGAPVSRRNHTDMSACRSARTNPAGTEAAAAACTGSGSSPRGVLRIVRTREFLVMMEVPV